MKKLLLFTALVFAVALKAQIEVRNEITNKVIAELDSTKDFSEYKKASQILGLIGHKIYAYPLNPKYDYNSFDILYQTPVRYKNDRGIVYKAGELRPLEKNDFEKLVEKKYLIVENVDFIVGKKVSPEDWDKENRFSSTQGRIKLYLKDSESENKFVLENGYNNFNRYLSVNYFDYLKKKYIGKKVVNNENNRLGIEDNIKSYSSLPKEINDNDLLTVKDIYIYQSDSKYAAYPEIKVLIINNSNESKEISLKSQPFIKGFDNYILKSDFDDYLVNFNKIQKKENEKYSEITKKREEEYKKNLDIKKVELSKKYGLKIGEKLAYGDIEIGMSSEMVRDALGRPDDINTTETKSTYSSQWIYRSSFGDKYYYFDNGKLTAIQK